MENTCRARVIISPANARRIHILRSLAIALAIAGISACGNGNSFPTPPSAAMPAVTKNAGSLGPVLSTSDGGEIFGFDINEKGNDGVLASAKIGRAHV